MKNNSALKILFLYNSIFVFANNLIGPLFALYLQGFHSSTVTISFTWAVFVFFTTIFTYLFSKFGDRIKEQEYTLMAGFLIRSIVWFLYIFTDSLSMVVVLQVVLALGEALGSPSFDTILSQHLDDGSQVAEYSTWRVMANLSMALATIIGGFVVAKFGFQVLFVVMSLLGLFAFFGVLSKPRELL